MDILQLTVVFAQLHTLGKWEGVHAFAVRIRDDKLNTMPGVRIKVRSASWMVLMC